jgi:hypothetical protein
MVQTLPFDIVAKNEEIAEIIATNCIGNVDEDYVDFCFNVIEKDCSTIYIKLLTDIADLPRIDTVNSHIYVSLYKMKDYVPDELIEAEVEITSPYDLNYTDLEEGKYKVKIRGEFALTGPTATVEKEWEYVLDLDCCGQTRENLKVTIKEKMAVLGCKIKDYGYIGRNTNKLFNALCELEVILWALCRSCCSNCERVALFKCKVDKIITDCNC